MGYRVAELTFLVYGPCCPQAARHEVQLLMLMLNLVSTANKSLYACWQHS